MQHGDLSLIRPERLIVILEGVLALVMDEVEMVGRLRKHPKVTGYNILWHEVPLKRMVMIGERYPDYGVEVVTFRSERLADLAADHLNDFHIPYSECRYQAYETFCQTLVYRPEVRMVYDSDPERLDGYGQHGVAVARGSDF